MDDITFDVDNDDAVDTLITNLLSDWDDDKEAQLDCGSRPGRSANIERCREQFPWQLHADSEKSGVTTEHCEDVWVGVTAGDDPDIAIDGVAVDELASMFSCM